MDSGALSRRSSFEQSPTSGLPFHHQLPPVRDVEKSEPSSPEIKRRRANGAGGYHAIAGTHGAYTTRPPPPDLRRTPPDGAAGLMRHYAATTLPDLASLPRSQSGPMPPPLRPPGSSSWSLDKEPLNRRHSGFDESLRLPPLQTSIPPSPSKSPAVDSRHVGIPSTRLNVSPATEPHSTSLETMATKEPSLTQRLNILSSITSPLPSAGRHGPRGDKRGAFIAVEGKANQSLLDEVGRSIEKAIVAGGDVALKVWSAESDEHEGVSVKTPARVEKGDDVDADHVLSSYFETILSWRQKSKQISHHISGGCNEWHAQDQNQEKDAKVAQALSTEACTPPEDDRGPAVAPKTPVALVKGGFSLTIADKYASAMTSSDKYTLVDHWKWIASLWRGIPNPDLAVYVEECAEDDGTKPGILDSSKDNGLIVVRVPVGKGLDEATERRMAFEVMEWVREGTFRH